MRQFKWIGLFLFLKLGIALSQLTPKQREKRDEGWRRQIRRKLYLSSRLPALQSSGWSTFSPVVGVLADRVTYSTADAMMVPAIVYRPDPKVVHWKGKLPGIVVVNGHGGDKFSWYAFYTGMMFAKAGAMVVTYDPIGDLCHRVLLPAVAVQAHEREEAVRPFVFGFAVSEAGEPSQPPPACRAG